MLLAVFYGAAGLLHLVHPEPFLSIMPGFVPSPEAVVSVTGVAELLGAIGLLQGRSAALRQAAGAGLAIYALCVVPANVQHLLNDLGRSGGGLGLAYHIPRLALQPLIIWLALWTGGVTDWPLHRR